MPPEDWTLEAVSNFGSVSAGRQKAPSFKDGEPRKYLRVANVYEAHIDVSDVLEMPFTDSEYSRYRLEPGDILLNEGQSIELVGRPAMYEGFPENCCFQNTLVRFKPNNRVNPHFALQLFRFCLHDGTFQKIAKKTTSIAHLGVSRFAELELLWPPLTEQTKIAQILSTWDKAIATSKRLLANSQQQKQALMQQLLTGQKRLAGFSENWKDFALGQLFSERNETNRPDLTLLSITTEQGVIDRVDSGKKDTSSEDKSKYRRICPGDIGYNTMRMWQGVSGLSDKEGIVSPAYTILQPTALVDSKFASYLFKTPTLIHIFMRHSQGLVSDTWNLKYEHFAKIKVFVPCVAEQQKIAQVLSAADAEIANLQAQLDKLKQEKKALMQQLLTGKRRVRLDDEEEDMAPIRRVG